MGLAVSLAFSSCLSYSNDIVFGSTQNASQFGLNWVMTNILPQQAGLTVGSVIYRYRAVKDPESDMIVYVQNENALGDGYIFREADDWSGLSGTGIYKVVPVGAIPLEYWGNGSIEIEGDGSVEDPSVVYTYQYDPCFDPQSNPDCDGYEVQYDLDDIIPVVDFKDPLEDELILEEIEDEEIEDKEEDEEEFARRLKIAKAKLQLQTLLGGINTDLLDSDALSQERAFFALNFIPPAYFNVLDGGNYEDTLVFKPKEMPKNENARRVGLAQQKLHEEMIKSQYDK
mgnify:FL=1